ncbi:phox (PX) domain-containing protein [Tasmannia lanceolata]|uniref:phox (PX) domain-containing protein n=1 Tax=Tasmannia lanceolata TaxID=3420 RepID=UPI0040636DD8
MINGEEIRENSSNPFVEFSPWLGQKLDADITSPASSNYSSCEESEFERYCSANSFVGTASLCSSVGNCNDFLGSDLGPVRTLGFREDDYVSESYGMRPNFERNYGNRGLVSGAFDCSHDDVIESLDCSHDGVIESHRENVNVDNGALLEESNVLSRVGNLSKSFQSHVESSSQVAVSAENSDENFLLPNGLNSSASFGENSLLYRSICEENSIEDLGSLRVGRKSELMPSSTKNATLYWDIGAENSGKNLTLSRGGNASELLPSLDGNYSLYEASDAENNAENLTSLRARSGSYFFAGSDEDSQSETDVPQEKYIEDLTGQVSCASDTCLRGVTSECGVELETDRREAGAVPNADLEIPSRCEHSDDEDSMPGYGTDDDNRIHLYEKTDLVYFKEAKTKNENPLLINSAVAFGSDDWDEFEHETEETRLASVMSDKTLKPQQWPLGTERNLIETLDSTLMAHVDAPIPEVTVQVETVRDIPIASCQTQAINGSLEDLESCSVRNFMTEEKDPCTRKPQAEIYSAESHSDAAERELQCICSKEVIGLDEDDLSEKELLLKSELGLNCASDIIVGQFHSTAAKAFEGKQLGFHEVHKSNMFPPMADQSHDIILKHAVKDSASSTDLGKCSPVPDEVEKLDLNEFYDDMVHEMEEILLDSGEPHLARFTQSNRGCQRSQPYRDGSSTASTSGADDAYPPIQYPPKIDWVEVVGAKQKKGDVSFGERLVGVKEYTVYKLKVWSGKDQWEVERRYRDFFTLYRQLKTYFTEQGWSLPSPWSDVERESRKIFGNASPDVITERSALIQECLRSIMQFRSPLGTPSPLVCFLFPRKSPTNSSRLSSPHQSIQNPVDHENSNSSFYGETCTGVSTFGKTISLIVDIQPHKPVRQLLEGQHYTCAGCHKWLDVGSTLIKGFVQTFGWGKPRLCEYTGQLFCNLCHTNETAVLPAKVLHLWDFSLYPVSQLAKAYLESIYDQPMLCVSAVNPLLFSKVPALLHVMAIRKKIGAMLPYVRCPFRRSILRGLGSRNYLLEGNDFFALRDLVDLSKGAFAALPVMVETVSRKILEHITQRCLVCCDVGIPCSARQACEDPSSLIFPFQESEVSKCTSCDSLFHEQCFTKLTGCPCGRPAEVDNGVGSVERMNHQAGYGLNGILDTSARKQDSKSSMGFFSDLFSKGRQENLWSSRNSNPVILMGSFPSASL